MPHITLQSPSSGTALTPSQVAAGATAAVAINPSNQLLKPDGSVLPTGGSAPSATTGAQGLVQLSGDLAGTASAPTVPGLANKQDRLTPGTTIKTIGGVNPLGAGDIPFPVVTPASIGAVATSTVGSPNGVAGLDATGKLPLSQIPVSIQGALTLAAADARYIRTINGLSPDASGNIEIAATGTGPGPVIDSGTF